jgi:hypothetical protein
VASRRAGGSGSQWENPRRAIVSLPASPSRHGSSPATSSGGILFLLSAAKVSFVGVNLNFDPTWLFLSLIPGGIGFVLMVYGKKQQRWLHFIFGALFTVYPYFTETVTMMVVVGLALGAALWMAVRAGY